MMLTKGAIGNLINRYSAVLKKCSLINTFGSLAVAGMLVLGGAAGAGAIEAWNHSTLMQDKQISEENINNKNLSSGSGGVYYSIANIGISNSIYSKNTASDVNYNTGGYGGVIFLGSGVLTITNSKFIENSAEIDGGAISIAKCPNNENTDGCARLIVRNSEFSKNKVTQYSAGAIGNYAIAEIYDSIFTENNVGGNNPATGVDGGGAIYLGGRSQTKIVSSIFTKNSSNYGGAIASTYEGQTSYVNLNISQSIFSENKATLDGGAIRTNLKNNIFINNTFQNNTANENGGAIALGSSSTTEITDSYFTGNAAKNGGAIYVAAGGVVTFKATKDIISSGNTATTAGGFLYLNGAADKKATATFDIADNATYTIGTAGATSNTDTIAGTAYSVLTKQGAGTLLVHSSMNGFEGITNVTAGTMKVTQAWNLGGAVNVSGGTLDVAEFTAAAGKVLTVSGTGTLKTGSINVFLNALDEAGTNVKDSGTLNTGITFTGGSLALTDNLYNLEYVKKASEEISSAKLVMLGKLANAGADNSIIISGLGGAGATLADVAVTTDNKNLVIGETTTDEGKTSHNNDLGVKNIDLGTGTSVTVKDDKTLTLVGGGGELVKTTASAANVIVENGKVQLGAEGANSGGTLNGSFDLKNGGALNAVSGNFTINGNITGDSGGGTVTVQNGNLNAQNVTSINTLTLDKGGSLIAETFTAKDSSSTITVGSTEGGAGTLIAKTADLKGASLFLDPAWQGDDEISDASKAGLVFTNNTVNGKLTVGRNSFILLGDTDTKWAESAFVNSGLKWGEHDVTAALFVKTSQTIDATGGILIDGSLDKDTFNKEVGTIAAAKNVDFRANSLLVVDGIAMTEKAALVGNNADSVLTVAASSKLLITNGKANDTVHIVSGFKGTGSKIDGWSGANLTTDSKLLTANVKEKFTTANGTYDVTLSQNSATSIFPKLDKDLGSLVDNMVQIRIDNSSDNYGQRFISRAVSDSFGVSTNAKEAAATIEGAAKIGFAGAAPQMAMNLANAAGNVASLRNSLAAAPQGAVVAMNDEGVVAHEGLAAGDGMKNGFGLWVMPTYQNQQAFGLESGEFETGYKSNAAGVALGADYTFNDMFRVGAQFNVGGGYAESSGDFNSTDNRFNYWGLGLYAGYQYENIGVTADFGYSSNNNEIEQTLPSSMQMAALKADAKTDTITVGLRGEYKFATESLDIVPHIGVRMTNMHMGSFDVKSDKHKVFKADDVNATVWTFPVGVTFSKDIETESGWTVKPSLDLAIVPAAGDIEAKQDVKIAGVNGSAQVESSIMDSISYQGSLGLSAKNDNGVSVGLNYTLQAGAHTTDHGVQATFRYEF